MGPHHTTVNLFESSKPPIQAKPLPHTASNPRGMGEMGLLMEVPLLEYKREYKLTNILKEEVVSELGRT
jgi:hypothetical protein